MQRFILTQFKVALIIGFINPQNVFAKQYTQTILEKHCSFYGGEVKKGHTCPKSGIYLPINICFFEDNNKTKFFDGCTGPKTKYTEHFYSACIKHDLCYHHEPISNGKTQKQCDQEFLENMKDSCMRVANKKQCFKYAKTMYSAVRMVGAIAFNCENSPQ